MNGISLIRVWIASFLGSAFMLSCLSLHAQTCREPNKGIEATLWEAYKNPNVCNTPYAVELIYRASAVAGPVAVPSLRSLVDDSACNDAFTHDAVITALAKLGDDAALRKLGKMLDGNGYADGSSVNMSYDVSNLLLIITESGGKVLETLTYDALGRGPSLSSANGVESVTLKCRPLSIYIHA